MKNIRKNQTFTRRDLADEQLYFVHIRHSSRLSKRQLPHQRRKNTSDSV